jgi:periplasmic protein TonB
MKTEATHLPTWNELVFSNRNRLYGAYLLRKLYHDHLALAFATSTLFLLLSMAMLNLYNSLQLKVEDFVPTVAPSTRLEHPPIIYKMPAPQKQVVQQKTVSDNSNYVATQKEVVETLVTPTEVLTLPSDNTGVNTEGLVANGPVEVTNTPVAINVPEIIDIAEVMPVYEGGQQAMVKFLGKKIKYPAAAERSKTEGTVYVSFVVSPTGTVTDVKVVKGISRECDAEAVRVVAMMNKWKAGLQHNVPVSVRMVLPIKFKIDNY